MNMGYATITWNHRLRTHVVTIVATANEARELAYGLGRHDAGAQELFKLADKAERLNKDMPR